jgi:NADH-quinone oxidoreductase subunit N
MVSLAGIPPLAGFFGKFLLLKAVIQTAQVTGNHGYYWLAFITLAGVVISLYYYFGVIRAIYWSKEPADLSPIELSSPAKFSIAVCIAGMFWIGLFPNTILNVTNLAAAALGR